MIEPITIRRMDFGFCPEPEPEDASSLHLIVVAGGLVGQLIRLEPGGVRIGRAVDNAVCWFEASISRYHAFLWSDEAGVVWLNDLGSTNETYVNGQCLQKQTPVRLKSGDLLRFGFTMTVRFVRLSTSEETFHRTLYERAVRDPLTGLDNRASFLDQAVSLIERGRLRNLGLIVLLLDIDHFKRVNDTHGHDAGDAVLRIVACALQQSVRPGDLVARYGGEEFVVAFLVPEATMGRTVAERIRQNVSDCVIGDVGEAIRVTASLGLAFARSGSTRTLNALITSADHALYEAKRGGRNRVCAENEKPMDLPPAPRDGTIER